MAVNDATIRLITEFEGFVPNWYPDPAHGWKVPTCCYGHTDAAGTPKYADTKAKVFTKTEGMDILRRDLGQYEAAVSKAVKVPLNPNQFGALTSFTYNLGASNLNKSTLLKKLNASDFKGAAAEFGKWNKAGGKVLAGLTRRREAERQLFLAQAPSIQPIPDLGPRLPPDAPVIVEPYIPKPATKAPRGVLVGISLAAFAAVVYFIAKQIGVVP